MLNLRRIRQRNAKRKEELTAALDQYSASFGSRSVREIVPERAPNEYTFKSNDLYASSGTGEIQFPTLNTKSHSEERAEEELLLLEDMDGKDDDEQN